MIAMTERGGKEKGRSYNSRIKNEKAFARGKVRRRKSYRRLKPYCRLYSSFGLGVTPAQIQSAPGWLSSGDGVV